jgi:hypothetical protein
MRNRDDRRIDVAEFKKASPILVRRDDGMP